MESNAVANCYLFLKYRRVSSISNVDYRIVLHVRSITHSNVMNIAADGTVAPDRSLLAEMNVANDLRAHVHIGSWVDLRMNTTKWPDHVFGNSNTAMAVSSQWSVVSGIGQIGQIGPILLTTNY
jgi:hypothetical protein